MDERRDSGEYYPGGRSGGDAPTPPAPAIVVDEGVTKDSANPVKSSGIWEAVWGTLAVVPTGFASLYDWCVEKLKAKRDYSDLAVYADAWSLLLEGASERLVLLPTPQAGYWTDTGTLAGQNGIRYMGDGFYRLFVADGTRGIANDVPEGAAEITFLDAELESEVVAVATKQAAATSDTLAKTSQIPSAATDAPLMDGAANAGASANYARADHRHPTDTTRADAADLRYRVAEAGFKYEFAASAFPITYTNTISSTAVTITAGDAGDITWDVQLDGGAYVRYNGFDFAYFSSTGDYGGSPPGVDLQFNGVAAANAGEPLVQILADRTVNLITADGETSIDIELPELANVGRMRDFYVRLTVSATSASTWTIGQGESWDAMGSPPSSFAAGTYLYHISEVAAGVWHCEDLFGVLNRIPKYPMVGVTPSNGTLTVSPYTVATYTAGDSAAAFTVAVGTGTSGVARDCELVIDCTETGAVAPTVTWPATFHPRTDAATDFACEAGTRNVYFISEFASGEFAVGGWQETAGGNAS